jgi:hypothetical protein
VKLYLNIITELYFFERYFLRILLISSRNGNVIEDPQSHEIGILISTIKQFEESLYEAFSPEGSRRVPKTRASPRIHVAVPRHKAAAIFDWHNIRVVRPSIIKKSRASAWRSPFPYSYPPQSCASYIHETCHIFSFFVFRRACSQSMMQTPASTLATKSLGLPVTMAWTKIRTM